MLSPLKDSWKGVAEWQLRRTWSINQGTANQPVAHENQSATRCSFKDNIGSRAEIKFCGLAIRSIGKLSSYKLGAGLIICMRTPVELNALAWLDCSTQIKATPRAAKHLSLDPHDVNA